MPKQTYPIATYQPKPRLGDKDIVELTRATLTDGEPCVSLMVDVRPPCTGTEILLTYGQLQRLARWCNWEPAKYPRKEKLI